VQEDEDQRQPAEPSKDLSGGDVLYIENTTAYKKRLCFDYMKHHNCRRGIMCWYAHGQVELRPKTQDFDVYMRDVFLPRHPRIKRYELTKGKGN